MTIVPPAYCPRCHLRFPSPIAFGEGATNISFSNNATTCPQCGGIAQIADGGIDDQGQPFFFFTEARRILSAPALLPLLGQLSNTIQAAQQSRATSQQITETLTTNFPLVAPELVKLFKQADSMGFGIAGVLAVLLQVLQMLMAGGNTTINNYYMNPPSNSSAQIQQMPLKKKSPNVNQNRKQRRAKASKSKRK